MAEKQNPIAIFFKVLYWRTILVLAHCLIPFMMISEQFGVMQYNRHVRRLKKAKKWIVNKLEKKGIRVTGEWSNYVIAEPTKEQIADFREIYSATLQHFSDIAPSEICAWAKPLGVLNKEWAISVGIDEYSAPQLTAPCFGCERQHAHGFIWGDDKSHKELYVENYVFVLKPEYRNKITTSYICKSCWQKYCR